VHDGTRAAEVWRAVTFGVDAVVSADALWRSQRTNWERSRPVAPTLAPLPYLQGIDPEEIIASVHMRRAPMMSASAGLRL